MEIDESIEFDWGDNSISRKSSASRKKESERMCALKLVALIKERSYGTNRLTIKQSELKKLIRCSAVHYWESMLDPVECALKLKMIKVDDSTRPFTYVLIDAPQTDELLLRPYQEDIIKRASSFKGSVLIEAPTGAGKSVIACEIAKNETAKGGKVLIVAPKLILMDQLQTTFSALNPQIIHSTKDYNTKHNVFISTLQTAHKRELGFEPTLIMIDEVHFGFEGKMIEMLKEDFEGRIIGLSATPYDNKGEPLKGFDAHINDYNLKYMINQGYLIAPLCYAPLKVDLAGITLQAGDYNQVELDKRFNNQNAIVDVVEASKERILTSKATLVFCINIAHSEAMAAAYAQAGVNAKAMHSKLPKEEQDKIMQEYKEGTIKALTNPVMLTTGFDDPKTDCIVLARATKSQNLYRQMVGRGLRLAEGKKHASIIDCSGVIENLGLPTEPIQKKEAKLSQKQVCSECSSERVFRRVIQNQPYLVCLECAHKEPIAKNHYECEACGIVVHFKRENFLTDEKGFYLVCPHCSHKTLLEEHANASELKLIFDSTTIKDLQRKVLKIYFDYLVDEPTLPFNDEYVRHMRALLQYIEERPQEMIVADIDALFEIEAFFNSFKKKYPDVKYRFQVKKEEGKRLFTKEFEDTILLEDIDFLKKRFHSAHTIPEAFALLNRMLVLRQEKPYDEYFIDTIVKQAQHSKIEKMPQMVLKRVKDLTKEHKSLDDLKEFIKMLESVYE